MNSYKSNYPNQYYRMNDATRQLVLLVGVMTILISGFVTMNFATRDVPETTSDAPANTTPTENSTTTVEDGESESPQNNRGRVEEDENATGLVGQSIKGWQNLWEDFNRALEILPGLSSNESNSSS